MRDNAGPGDYRNGLGMAPLIYKKRGARKRSDAEITNRKIDRVGKLVSYWLRVDAGKLWRFKIKIGNGEWQQNGLLMNIVLGFILYFFKQHF